MMKYSGIFAIQHILVLVFILTTASGMNATVKCPSASWKRFGNICYTSITNVTSWQNGNKECQKRGGQLARITGADLNNFIRKVFRKGMPNNLWIGLRKCNVTWCYLDGTPSVYYNWENNTGQPNNARGNEYCVDMRRGGRWNDQDCGLNRSSVCEIPLEGDECMLRTQHHCHSQATCNNTIGSYSCVCNKGFTGNGTVCEDVDECMLGTHSCHSRATCNDTIGSYTCTCNEGFKGNGTVCTAGCPSVSWKKFGIFCYLVNSDLLTWVRANDYCKSKGGQLARITGVALENFLVQTYRKSQSMNIWIGLKKCGKAWCFPDGKQSNYYNWEPGEPNNHRGDEYCVVMLRNGSWYDQSCQLKRPSFCEIRADECLLGGHKCHPQASCNNTIGSYTCTCNEGFTGNGTVCKELRVPSTTIQVRSEPVVFSTTKEMNDTKDYGILNKMKEEVDILSDEDTTEEERREGARKIVDELSKLTNLGEGYGRQTAIDQEILTETVVILQKIVHLNISDENLNILSPASNILDIRNEKIWKNMTDGEAIRQLVITLENYGFQQGDILKNNTRANSIFQGRSNVQLQVKYVARKGVLSYEENLFDFPNASLNLSPDALPKESGAVVVVIFFKTLNSFLVDNFYTDDKYADVNSSIISASVQPQPKTLFKEPVRISWETEKLDESKTCVYWKPELGENRWRTDGCRRVIDKSYGSRFVCECNHLTAFASMEMSGYVIGKAHRTALEIISTIGCSVSLFGIFLTILAHALVWKRLHKNAKTKIPTQVLMNLCVAIGMADIFAIMGGPAQTHETFCVTVSILLYFSVLALFGWMLCEGIIIYFQLVNVYSGLGLGGKHMKAFYVIGWGIPVVVVSTLVGSHDLEDFKSEYACWYRAGGVLFWTFVGTIGLVLLINLIIFILALRNALSTKEVNTSGPDASAMLKKAKMGLRGSAVLLPLLGLTWVFGLFVFNRDTIVFKYLFAIFNSLQGLVIFIFHVLLNKKIHEAINKEKRSRDARRTNYAMVKNNARITFSTGEMSSEKFEGDGGLQMRKIPESSGK
ncbi:CD97 antigen-like [Dendronephthya gigantea]|uniref:CD97 antigen-like n=1 Tax=Dendronephthya gigantea TaxID=151771 RepID=UPI00106A38F1|nr:CD97 antigen-like [Dendronephthya gigantea]